MTEDPFAHLHLETYGDAYREPRATWRDAVHMRGRPLISLDGPWHVTPDLFDEGLRQRWFANDDTRSRNGPRPATPICSRQIRSRCPPAGP